MGRVTHRRAADNRLSRHLKEGELLTSSELIARLRQEGLSDANARKIISRNSNTNGVWRSQDLRLARDERLFGKKEFCSDPSFLTAVGEKLHKTSRKGFARCLVALGQEPVVHRVNLIRLLAVPAEGGGQKDRSTTTPPYENELAGLRELRARLIHQGTALESIVAPPYADSGSLDSFANYAAQQLRFEALLTRFLVDRLRRQNMVSWNRVELPNVEKPYVVFNRHLFSGYGFSYLSSIVRWKEAAERPTPCPVLIDCYHDQCTLPYVESFLQRIERATIRGRRRLPVLCLIAARDFDVDAWKCARRAGLMTVSFRQMFGDEALEAMAQVEQLLNGLGRETLAEGEQRFQRIAKLFDDLKTNPVISDLRSIGFEAVSGLILQAQGFEGVEPGRVVPWQNTARDVDVFGLRGDELRIIECKAYHRKKSLSVEDVRKFFTQTVPALKRWLRNTERSFSKCTASIWTTGPKGKDAGDFLYGLSRPDGDLWEIQRMSDSYGDIPRTIRERSVKLLESIAIAKTEATVDSLES
jgi:hypothetical protein